MPQSNDGLKGSSVIYADRINYARRIFANRNLRLDSIEAIGFDMDYTLAIYTRDLQHLAAELALGVMVEHHGYPNAIKDIGYDPDFPVRGLVLDKKKGHIFKMDAHRHVGTVYHGLRKLKKEEVHKAYRHDVVRLSASRYALMDTLFELPEAYLFARLVEWVDDGKLSQKKKNYGQIYEDLRYSIDEIHKNGSLKSIILKDRARYIERDPALAQTLSQIRSVGKKVFLLTNSEWSFTDRVMKYLLDGQLEEYSSWRNYFDVIVTFACKPLFFSSNTPFERLTKKGKSEDVKVKRLERGRVYQRGNVKDFERFTGFHGDAVLYVGDHIYGDVLRSKKAASWRTAMVVPEMDEELERIEAGLPHIREHVGLERARHAIDDDLVHQELYLKQLARIEKEGGGSSPEAIAEARQKARDRIKRLQAQIQDNLKRAHDVDAMIAQNFNPYWGMLFNSGDEHSAFGNQIEQYACLYTGRVSNFLLHAPTQYFRTPRDRMPHERWDLY